MGTIADVVTNNKTYYNCPRCGSRKWAYGSYAGGTCWNCCPSNLGGFLVDAATATVDTTIEVATGDAVHGVTGAAVGFVCDKATGGSCGRVSYKCPDCSIEVWAYQGHVGHSCKNCMRKRKATKTEAMASIAMVTGLGDFFEASFPSMHIF